MCGANKVSGTKEHSDRRGGDTNDVPVPGDVENDTETPKSANMGTVTGNVRDESKYPVLHTIVDTMDDGSHKVPVYPGPTRTPTTK